MRAIALTAALLVLTACGSSPSPVLPPVDLTPIKDPLEVSRQWKLSIGQGVSDHYLKLKPAFKNDTGYVIDYKGKLKTFSVKDGNVLNEYDLELPVSAGLLYSSGNLFLGTGKGELLSLDASNAKVLWRAQLSSEILATPAVADNIVVVKTVDGRVYGLNARDGAKAWVYDRSVPRLTLRGSSSPVISNDIVLTASDSGKLSALSLQSGKLLWETTIAVAQGRSQLERVIDMDVDPVVVDDVVYAAGYQGRIAAVKISSGQILWSRDFSTYSGLYVDAFRVYVTDAEGQAWALNRYNGSTLWRQDKLLRRKLTAPEAYDKYIVIGDYDGYIHWLNRDDGKLVGRRRINESNIHLFEEETEKEKALALLYSKWNNVLVTPVLYNNLLISLDRVGRLEAFKIVKTQ